MYGFIVIIEWSGTTVDMPWVMVELLIIEHIFVIVYGRDRKSVV